MENTTQIKCPECGATIDVQNILKHQIEGELKNKFEEEIRQGKEKLKEQENKIAQEREELEQLKKEETKRFEEELDKKLKSEKEKLEKSLREKLDEETSGQFEVMQKELSEKSKQLKELNKTKAEIEKLKREKEEIKDEVEAKAQLELNKMLLQEKEKIKKSEGEKTELTIRELKKQLEDQKKLTEEMKRKQEQGSMQLQGEVQELAIEEWLADKFPLDRIDEIKKGARGADCVQVVNTRTKQNCGTIYYESKRTKNFQASWIEKLKADMREIDADVGVIVTEAMPDELDRMGLMDGIWVCSFDEFKGLSMVLRESVIQLGMALSSQENKGDKMNMLYDYLTSTTFRMQVEAIVEGFSSMKDSLEKEKRSMHRIWKEREKQIEKVTSSTIDMYGSIKGIAGNAVQPVKALELPSHGEEEEE